MSMRSRFRKLKFQAKKLNRKKNRRKAVKTARIVTPIVIRILFGPRGPRP